MWNSTSNLHLPLSILRQRLNIILQWLAANPAAESRNETLPLLRAPKRILLRKGTSVSNDRRVRHGTCVVKYLPTTRVTLYNNARVINNKVHSQFEISMKWFWKWSRSIHRVFKKMSLWPNVKIIIHLRLILLDLKQSELKKKKSWNIRMLVSALWRSDRHTLFSLPERCYLNTG